MSRQDLNLLCSEAEIRHMVHSFYDVVRHDPHLAPIFNAHVHDWTPHLERMVQFWSNLLRGTGRYRGTPMPMHMKLPDLSESLFQRWLALFKETSVKSCTPEMAQRANFLAARIAQSLWFSYQMNKWPDKVPANIQIVE